ncbi:MAG: mitochondrial fission ELM1 family protein [Hyphomicrobiaceae bacterium]|nr:mitochondrial fission ELM1 family protein [Hyphomicrobiaceae bacterium]
MTADQNDSRIRPLAGRPGWVITDGKAGMLVQARGVADALGLAVEMKTVAPKGLQRFVAPWGSVSATEKFGQPGAQFSPPWPAVAIATGRASIPYIRALRRAAGPNCYTVVLQDPRSGIGTADLIWVPAHDTLRGPNVVTTLTAPHSFSQERIAGLRGSLPGDVAALPSPRIAVVLGGKNGVYKFREEDDTRLEQALRATAATGASFMITSSRRTHLRLIAAVERATRDAPRIIWTGDGENPYPAFLGAADSLVVTADSVNMCGEACATGRPVYVFSPSGGSAKFTRFHDGLRRHGATRELPETGVPLEAWDYQPLDSARLIAQEIEMRWQRRAAMLKQ